MTPLRLRIKELREAKNLSQEQLAELVGVRQATISNHERGKASRIDFSLMENLAAALGVGPGALLVQVPDDPAEGNEVT